MAIWVNKNNQAWASEVTGIPLEEIKRRYEERGKRGRVTCTIEDHEFRTVPDDPSVFVLLNEIFGSEKE